MSETTAANLSERAICMINADCRAFKRDTKRYADYVAETGLTLDTLPDHVAAFRDTYRLMYPKADGAEVKAYATKVRNGLRYHIAKEEKATEEQAVKYVTAAGLKDSDRAAFLAKCAAEYDAAQG